jgi:general secretion pathway protein L
MKHRAAPEERGEMFHYYMRWWLRQISEALPISALSRAVERDAAATLELRDGFVTLMLHRGAAAVQSRRVKFDEAGLREVQRAASDLPDPLRVMLRIASGTALFKRLTVPVAARRHLETLLGFELDRETPFSREEIHWDYRVRQRDKERGTIELDLAVVPRAVIDPAIATIRAAGLQPVGIQVGDADAGLVTIRLEHDAEKPGWRANRGLVLAGVAAGALAVAAVATPFVRQQAALASAEDAITQSMAAAKEAAALRQALDRRSSSAGNVAQERARSGSALGALAAVTRALPDDTYLTALSLRQGRAVMTGLAPSAAALVRSLAQVPELKDPAYESQVVTNESGGRETFTISVGLRSPGQP